MLHRIGVILMAVVAVLILLAMTGSAHGLGELAGAIITGIIDFFQGLTDGIS